MAYELGCNVVVNRIGKIPEDQQDPRWVTMVQVLTDIGNHSHRAGAWLAAKTGAESGAELKSMLENLPIQSLGVDFDPAELLVNGYSPTESMKALANDVMNLRARDAVTDLSLGRGVEVPMGQGSVDWPALLSSLEEQSYSGYLTVQSDLDENSLVTCSQAFGYLDALF